MTPSGGLLETVNRSFDAAAALGEYPPGLLEQIKTCNSVYRFHFPIRKEGAATRSSKRGAPNTATTSYRPRAVFASHRRWTQPRFRLSPL